MHSSFLFRRHLAPVSSAAARPRARALGRYAASRLCTQPLRGLAPVYSAAARPRRASALGRYATSRLCPRPLRGLALHKSTCTVLFYSAGISRLCPRPLRGLARLFCTPHPCKQARAPPSPRAGTPSHSISQSCWSCPAALLAALSHLVFAAARLLHERSPASSPSIQTCSER